MWWNLSPYTNHEFNGTEFSFASFSQSYENARFHMFQRIIFPGRKSTAVEHRWILLNWIPPTNQRGQNMKGEKRSERENATTLDKIQAHRDISVFCYMVSRLWCTRQPNRHERNDAPKSKNNSIISHSDDCSGASAISMRNSHVDGSKTHVLQQN